MLKIIIIEDEESLLEELLLILEFEGYDTIGCNKGDEGIQLIKEHMPDLIISDIMMSPISGYDILKMIREDPETAHIPFIFLTAVAERSAMRQGMTMGADDYLTKPFSKDELLRAIHVRIHKYKVQLEAMEKQQVKSSKPTDDAEKQLEALTTLLKILEEKQNNSSEP